MYGVLFIAVTYVYFNILQGLVYFGNTVNCFLQCF